MPNYHSLPDPTGYKLNLTDSGHPLSIVMPDNTVLNATRIGPGSGSSPWVNLVNSMLSGPLNFVNLADLREVNLDTTQPTSVNFTNCPNLTNVIAGTSVNYMGWAVIDGCASLATIDFSYSTLIDINLGTNASLLHLDFSRSLLPEAAVDAVLASLDSHGLHDGWVNVSSGGNAQPSAAGLVSKANLVAKGWTVIISALM